MIRAAGLARFLANYAYMVTCSGGADACDGEPRDRNANHVVMSIFAEEVTAIEHLFHRDGYVATRGPNSEWFAQNCQYRKGSPAEAREARAWVPVAAE